ncbi:hypothetical protein [Infirmifilum uzonense]|uniref:hypothetical protein n=1 Tax=Infirmifilum uzonense TaxID=1550241 RepID=UPI003C726519
MLYHIIILVSSKVRSRKRRMIEREIEEKIGEDLGFIGEIGNSSRLPWEEHRMDETWLMVQKGLKYIPDIIDSMSYFSVSRIMETLGLDQESGWKCLREDYESLKKEMEKTYPYATLLIDKVKPVVRSDRYFRRITQLPYGLLWPVDVFGLREVMDEVGILLKEGLFSKANPKDREIAKKWMKRYHISKKELNEKTEEQLVDEYTSFLSEYVRHFGNIFKKSYEVYKKYNVEMWFTIKQA